MSNFKKLYMAAALMAAAFAPISNAKKEAGTCGIETQEEATSERAGSGPIGKAAVVIGVFIIIGSVISVALGPPQEV